MTLFRSSSFYLLTAAVAAAQTIPASPPGHTHDEPLALENIVVTAAPYARSQADIAQPTSVLAGRELNLRQAPTLGELLSGQPGVSSTYFGPGASRPIIRGLGGDRVRILENSLGTIDASIISPDHAVSLDPLLIERVEVVRGPAALLYGGNAVGGVVNVITHRIHTSAPDHALQGRFEVRADTGASEKAAGLVLEGAAGPLAWHVDGYRRTAGDVSIPGYAESAARRAAEAHEEDHEEEHDHEEHEEEEAEAFGFIPNTALRTEGGAAGVSFIGTRGYVGLALSTHRSRYGIPAGAHSHGHGEHDHDEEHEEHDDHDEDDHAEEEHAHEEGAVRIDLRQQRFDLQGELTEAFGPFRGARFKLGTARYRHTELEGDEVGTIFRNRGYDGRVELLHQPLAGFTGAFGWQGARSEFEAIGAEAFVPPSDTTSQALFVFEERELKPVVWQLGARAEKQEISVRDGSGRARDDDLVSLSSGLIWSLGADWTLGTSLARTERAPNAQELYADGAHAGTNAYEIGDAGLRRERSLALDVTLRRRTGFVTGAFTVFTNRFDGFVFEQPTGQVAIAHDDHFHFHDEDDEDAGEGLAVYRFVQRDAQFHGAEFEAIFHLHADTGRQLDLILGADVVRGRNRTDGTDLPRLTPSRLKAGLAWNHGPLALGTEVQFVARQDRTAAYETPTAAYELISAYANFRLGAGPVAWDFFVRGTNLGDREARMHTSFLKEVAPLPGRNLTAGLRASF
jgi:iron complex outermembrane receptor protein